jgi:hypothetical protein
VRFSLFPVVSVPEMLKAYNLTVFLLLCFSWHDMSRLSYSGSHFLLRFNAMWDHGLESVIHDALSAAKMDLKRASCRFVKVLLKVQPERAKHRGQVQMWWVVVWCFWWAYDVRLSVRPSVRVRVFHRV